MRPAPLPLLLVLTPLFAGPALAAPPRNEPPVCDMGVPTGSFINVPRQGPVTVVTLDASASFDPDGDPIEFLWQTGCLPGFDDPTAAVTNLFVDTPAGATVTCGIRLRVSDATTSTHCRVFLRITDESRPELDIKPGSCPNPVQVGSGGVLPAALVGTASFDVADVDRATLRLSRVDGVGGAVAPTKVKTEDVATPFDGNGCDCHTLRGDGRPDLALKFDKRNVVEVLQLGSVPNKTFVEVRLSGLRQDGSSFEATDCIRVQGT